MTEYSQYRCKTENCRVVSLTQAANTTMQAGQRVLRCTNGHRHEYTAHETRSIHIESPPDIRAKMGLK